MGLIEQYKNTKSFLTIKEGESFVGVYQGMEEATNKFGDTIRYTFLIDGQTKMLDTPNASMFRAMSNVKEGTTVKVSRVNNESGRGSKFLAEEMTVNSIAAEAPAETMSLDDED